MNTLVHGPSVYYIITLYCIDAKSWSRNLIVTTHEENQARKPISQHVIFSQMNFMVKQLNYHIRLGNNCYYNKQGRQKGSNMPTALLIGHANNKKRKSSLSCQQEEKEEVTITLLPINRVQGTRLPETNQQSNSQGGMKKNVNSQSYMIQ